ncbi:hypothetical protein SUGI_0697420 [Cryptomeria japonica]|nr:hypothetical protein SUGI_0697420 [Cryptomeria japonica]
MISLPLAKDFGCLFHRAAEEYLNIKMCERFNSSKVRKRRYSAACSELEKLPKLGHLEAVQELIKGRPDAVEMRNSCGMNVLHLAAQVNQVRIVDCLNERVGLSELVNQGLEKPPEEKPLQSGGNTEDILFQK